MSTYWIGADIGQSSDPTAIAILEKRFPPPPPRDNRVLRMLRYPAGSPPPKPETPQSPPPTYVVKYLERVRLQTSYPAVVERLAQVLRDPQLDGPARLVLDGTGVGRVIVDMAREAGLNPLAISIHGGDNVTYDGGYVRVPKRDLVGMVRRLLDEGRLHIIDSIPDAQALRRELQNFNYKINPATAHDSYSAWREGMPDDLVLTVVVAVRAAEPRNGVLPARCMYYSGRLPFAQTTGLARISDNPTLQHVLAWLRHERL